MPTFIVATEVKSPNTSGSWPAGAERQALVDLVSPWYSIETCHMQQVASRFSAAFRVRLNADCHVLLYAMLHKKYMSVWAIYSFEFENGWAFARTGLRALCASTGVPPLKHRYEGYHELAIRTGEGFIAVRDAKGLKVGIRNLGWFAANDKAELDIICARPGSILKTVGLRLPAGTRPACWSERQIAKAAMTLMGERHDER